MYRMHLLSRRTAAVGLAAALAAGGVAVGVTQAAATTSSPRTCTTSDLYLSMGAKGPGAGQLYWPIQFTNTSTSTCALRGYPGVSVLNTAHHQIGAPATHTGQAYGTVTVRPDQRVTALLHTTLGPIGGPCRPAGTYLRVYPPASSSSVLVPAPLTVCSNVFTVGPVTTQSTF
jgi:hypothetical protein